MPSSRTSSSRRPAAVATTLLAAALRAQSAGVFIGERQKGTSSLRIVFANESFCALTGHAARELVGRDYELLQVEAADLERVREWMPRAKPGEPIAGEGVIRRADGAPVSVSWSFDPLFEAGEMTHVVATYRDQTEKRRLQEALVHAQRLDAVGRLAGGVAHDFNNLISVINGYCEILAAHVAGNPQAMREVAEIHGAGRKAAVLTQQLLAFSRRQPLDMRVLNLNTLIRDNEAILTRLIGDAGKLELELAPDLANVRTDAAQFQQVVFNLVLNARDALRGNGRIVITTANRTIGPTLSHRGELAPGRYVVMAVKDNGTGMDADTMKHLFEPFFTTKPEGKGTGLGLALVYGVVQQSGGTVGVSSEVLAGSRFEVLLPAVKAPVELKPGPAMALPSLRGHETVWIVEPDDVVRKMVAGMLTTDGYRVTALSNAADAPRDQSLLHNVELLITSFRGEGEKLARRILSRRSDLRVLVIGEGATEEGPIKWLAPARQKRLNKPYVLSELLREVRRLLDTNVQQEGKRE
ncbi:ATP-binding protein [Opitutus sp. ER46]|uniref:ATP-binding protein n=1 Tax=Opitutus sp. ER46 TaxID=2161864 RepID=UPI000D3114C7|nr:ATP-binding protein [Opitutus sp. ER46]PTX98612.1 hypothetical protein DB354_04935 [Opitutus sp. ER46]